MINRAHAIEFIRQVHETLSEQTDLSPKNPIVTDCSKRFIEFLSTTYQEDWANRLPDAPELAKVAGHLPLLCGRAECRAVQRSLHELDRLQCSDPTDSEAISGVGDIPGAIEAQNVSRE
jgi:hypothetical protein